jgi:hypothetical protein
MVFYTKVKSCAKRQVLSQTVFLGERVRACAEEPVRTVHRSEGRHQSLETSHEKTNVKFCVLFA